MSELDARFLDRRPPEAFLVASFDRGSAKDASGYNRTPTTSAGATFVSRVIDFDGTSSAVSTYPDDVDWEQFPLSVSFRFRLDSATNGNGWALVTKSSIAASPSTSYRGWYINYFSSGGAAGVRLSIVEDTFTKYRSYYNGVTTYGDGIWRHLVAVFNGYMTAPTLYINGLSSALTFTGGGGTVATLATPDPVRIAGRAYFEQNQYVNGAVDDLVIVPRALTAAEALALYNGGLNESRP